MTGPDPVVACYDQVLMLQDEHVACEDVKRMRKEQPGNEAEIKRLQDIADTASIKLRDHTADCLVCRRPTTI
jgi:hypothetical protein